MRWLLLLLMLPFAFALENVMPGDNPVVYGSFIAYEQNNSVHLYNTESKLDLVVARGRNPSLFGYVLAFDAKEVDDLNNDGDVDDSVVHYYNIQEQSLKTAGIGRLPHVFSNFIVFSTQESDLNVDFSNDRDAEDDILRIFYMANGELLNFKAVGFFPVATRRTIAFLTAEAQAGIDLNDDGDKLDTVLRVLDLQTRGVSSTRSSASDLSIGKNLAVFSSDTIKVFDMNTQEIRSLPVSGNHPAIFGDVVVFERDGELYAYDLEIEQISELGVKGAKPVLFDNLLAFVSDENIAGDLDGNGVNEKIVRFSKENFEHLSYEDCDSVEDSCAGLNKIEKKEEVPIENKSTAVEKNISVSQNQTAEIEEESSLNWYVFGIVLIVAVFVGVYYGYKYHQKRKKSFGF